MFKIMLTPGMGIKRHFVYHKITNIFALTPCQKINNTKANIKSINPFLSYLSFKY